MSTISGMILEGRRFNVYDKIIVLNAINLIVQIFGVDTLSHNVITIDKVSTVYMLFDFHDCKSSGTIDQQLFEILGLIMHVFQSKMI